MRGGGTSPRVQDPVHPYGLRPELGLVWGGRGPSGAGGPELVSEEKEPGEERERQDEADQGQCACRVHLQCECVRKLLITCKHVDVVVYRPAVEELHHICHFAKCKVNI